MLITDLAVVWPTGHPYLAGDGLADGVTFTAFARVPPSPTLLAGDAAGVPVGLALAPLSAVEDELGVLAASDLQTSGGTLASAFEVAASPVPEPAMGLLVGLTLLAVRRRWRTR